MRSSSTGPRRRRQARRGAPQTARNVSVSCTSCPPGAERAFGRCPAGELLRCPDIEDIQITVRRFAPPFVERLGIDRSDAETFRDARRRRQRLFQTRLRDFRRTPRRALDDVEAGQMPVLRPVFPRTPLCWERRR